MRGDGDQWWHEQRPAPDLPDDDPRPAMMVVVWAICGFFFTCGAIAGWAATTLLR